MKDITIIGISGKICSGKTTLANAIVEADPRYIRHGIGEEIRVELCEKLGLSREHMDAHKEDYVDLLQAYGNLMRRIDNPNYWVGRLLDWIQRTDSRFVIVDDMRFPNEVEMFGYHSNWFTSIRLEIDEELQARRYWERYRKELSREQRDHISETALDDYDRFGITFKGAISQAQVASTAILQLRLAGFIQRQLATAI